tara:strand:+ start:3093 stop:3869 length:777 start_codon:yes stop_codon:yes gene_type:complete
MKKFQSPIALLGVSGEESSGLDLIEAAEANRRLSGALEVRASESIESVIAAIEPGQVVNLAPDVWTYNKTLVINKSCSIIGHPLGTRIHRGDGLGQASLVLIENCSDVVLKNIYFDDPTEQEGINCIETSSASNVFVSGCIIKNFDIGIQHKGSSDGGDFTANLFNTISATTSGIQFLGSSKGHRVLGNSIALPLASSYAVDMPSGVSSTAVTGNTTLASDGSVCKIKFDNAGVAQSFANPGGRANLVSGNVANLEES